MNGCCHCGDNMALIVVMLVMVNVGDDGGAESSDVRRVDGITDGAGRLWW